MHWLHTFVFVTACHAFVVFGYGDSTFEAAEESVCPPAATHPGGGLSLIQREKTNRSGHMFIPSIINALFGSGDDKNVSNTSNASLATPNASEGIALNTSTISTSSNTATTVTATTTVTSTLSTADGNASANSSGNASEVSNATAIIINVTNETAASSDKTSEVINTTAEEGVNTTQVDVITTAAYYDNCADYPVNWTSSSQLDCQRYVLDKFCTPDGGYGSAWDRELQGNFSEWKVNGSSAVDACCGCGGGRRLTGVGNTNATASNRRNASIKSTTSPNSTTDLTSNMTVGNVSAILNASTNGSSHSVAVERIFDLLDNDGDGQLTPEELRSGIR